MTSKHSLGTMGWRVAMIQPHTLAYLISQKCLSTRKIRVSEAEECQLSQRRLRGEDRNLWWLGPGLRDCSPEEVKKRIGEEVGPHFSKGARGGEVSLNMSFSWGMKVTVRAMCEQGIFHLFSMCCFYLPVLKTPQGQGGWTPAECWVMSTPYWFGVRPQ